MKTADRFSCLALSVAALFLGSCSTDSPSPALAASLLEPGVRYEVRQPLPALQGGFATRALRNHYYSFMPEAPPLNSFLFASAPSASDLLHNVRTTAYCHSESDHLRYGRLAAVGSPLRFGAVCSAAADWSRYPLGTTFRIKSQPGVIYEVDDYGSALVGSATIDLYRPTLGGMNDWGVRAVDIEILKWGSYQDSLRLMRDRIQYPHVRRMFLDIQKRLDQAASQLIQTIPTSPV